MRRDPREEFTEQMASLLKIRSTNRGRKDDDDEREEKPKEMDESEEITYECSICLEDSFLRNRIVILPCCATIICHDCANMNDGLFNYNKGAPVCAAKSCKAPLRNYVDQWSSLIGFKGVAGALEAIQSAHEHKSQSSTSDDLLARDDTEKAWIGVYKCNYCGQAVVNDGTRCDVVLCSNPECNEQTNVLLDTDVHTYHLEQILAVLGGKFTDRDSLLSGLLEGTNTADPFVAFVALKLPVALTRALKAACAGDDKEVNHIKDMMTTGGYPKFAEYIAHVVASIVPDKAAFYKALTGCRTIGEILRLCMAQEGLVSEADVKLLQSIVLDEKGIWPSSEQNHFMPNCGFAWSISDLVLSSVAFSCVTHPGQL